MFRQLDTGNTDTVVITVDGVSLEVPAGISLAAALLLSDNFAGRLNPVSGQQRSGICMMGVCFECLMEVDGINQRSCQIDCEAGMVVTTQQLGVYNTNDD